MPTTALRAQSGQPAGRCRSGCCYPQKGRHSPRGELSPSRYMEQDGAGEGLEQGTQVECRDKDFGLPHHPTDFSSNELSFSVTSKSYKRGWHWEQMPSLSMSLLKL